MKFHQIQKSLIITLLFISLCALTNKKSNIYVNKDNLIANDTTPEPIISSKKAIVSNKKSKLYKIYRDYCNEIVVDTIQQTGYLVFDTLRVSSIPVNKLYFGKPIINSVQISKEIANIIVIDTVWNLMEAPEYRSTWEYYVLAKNPIPKTKKIDIDYSNKIIVSRPKEYTMKRSKPLVFSDWKKYIYKKTSGTSPTEEY